DQRPPAQARRTLRRRHGDLRRYLAHRTHPVCDPGGLRRGAPPVLRRRTDGIRQEPTRIRPVCLHHVDVQSLPWPPAVRPRRPDLIGRRFASPHPVVQRRDEGELFRVAAAASRTFPEHFMMSLHGLLARQRQFFRPPLRISLEIAAAAGAIRLQLWIPYGEKTFIESQLRAAYPSLELVALDSPTSPGPSFGVADVRLAHGSHLPIRTAFESEPLANLLWTLTRVREGHHAVLQLVIRPISSRW